MLEGYSPQGSLLHPGVTVKDITRKFPSLVQCSDYYPLLILHENGDEVTTRSQSKQHQKRLQGLGTIGEGSKGTGFFPPFSHVQVVTQINRWIQSINMWL